MTKVELKNVFCLCPVRREDWHLLGLQWQDRFYIDKYLQGTAVDPPIALRGACNTPSTLLMIFFFTGPVHTLTCFRALEDMLQNHSGLPPLLPPPPPPLPLLPSPPPPLLPHQAALCLAASAESQLRGVACQFQLKLWSQA